MNTLTFSIRDEVFSIGRHFEDAEEIIETRFFVVAEDFEGHRWRHFKTFRVDHECAVHGCGEQEGPCLANARQPYKRTEEAQAAAERLLARIKAAPPKSLDNDYWEPTVPCYGSVAWEEEGQEAKDAAWERAQEGR